MTFLNPFVLFGLAAAAIPILIHLLNKRKLRTIEFSTLVFLKELQRNKIRKITIRQWLLLILRTLLIIFLVLAFSRPAIQGSFSTFGAHVKTSMVIILDNTASMDQMNERGKFLQQARLRALQIISLLQENDDVTVLRLSDLPSATIEKPTHDISKLTSLIQETRIAYNVHTIEEGVRKAIDILNRSNNLNKEIHIISDGQTSTLSPVEAMPKYSGGTDEKIKLFYTVLSNSAIDNIGIEKITIPPSVLQPGKPVMLDVALKNYGATATANHLVSVTIGNQKVAQKNITLQSGENVSLEFSITPNQSGFLNGYVETEDDLFMPDNKKYFSLYIPEQVKVLLVSSERRYSRFVSTALSLSLTTVTTPVLLTSILPNQITATIINNNDVIILSGVNVLSDATGRMIRQFISDGGGLIFFPSADTVDNMYGYLKQFQIGSPKILRSPKSYSLTVEKFDRDFPVFNGMFERQTSTLTIESPAVTTSLAFPKTQNIQPVMTLSNGVPLMWQEEIGAGKLLGFSVPATTEWSDFPYKGLFVTLLYQSSLYLTSHNSTFLSSREYYVGEKIVFSTLQLKKGTNNSFASVTIEDSQHQTIPVTTYTQADNSNYKTVFSTPAIFDPGIYSVMAKTDTLLSVPVNIRNAESDGTLATKEQFFSMCTRNGIKENLIFPIPVNMPIEAAIHQSRYGLELWRYFAVIAFLCALAEMIVAREKKDV